MLHTAQEQRRIAMKRLKKVALMFPGHEDAASAAPPRRDRLCQQVRHLDARSEPRVVGRLVADPGRLVGATARWRRWKPWGNCGRRKCSACQWSTCRRPCTHVDFPRVTVDQQAVGRLAAEHLLERGFRRTGYFGRRGMWYSQQRQQGFAERIRQGGGECSVFETPHNFGAAHPCIAA